MYSVVLMAAMVTTPDVPDFGRKGHGCCPMDCSGCGSSHGHARKHRGHGCCGGCAQSCGCCGAPCGGGCGSPCGGMAAPPVAPPANVPPPKPMAALSPTSATIVVSGAADAKVTIGGLVSGSTADTRVMVSPTLEAGQTFYYDLTAEVNGVKLAQSVAVRAGELTEVNLDFVGKTVAMK